MPRSKRPHTVARQELPSPPPSVPADVDEPSETEEESATAEVVTRPPKKQYRVSYKDIKNYPFTDAQEKELVQFVEAHHCLYMKNHRQYADNKEKSRLWHACAALFAGATWVQCRKFFEQKRTAFGKLEAAEMKSGAEYRTRTPREQELVKTWGFFKGHIAHQPTTSSQKFSNSDPEASSSSTSEGQLSAASIERRRVQRKKSQKLLTSWKLGMFLPPKLTQQMMPSFTPRPC